MNKPRLLAHPNTCPGAYVLHLYCKYENEDHAWGEFPHQPVDVQTASGAARQARWMGWKLHDDGTATCPKCAKALGLPK